MKNFNLKDEINNLVMLLILALVLFLFNLIILWWLERKQAKDKEAKQKEFLLFTNNYKFFAVTIIVFAIFRIIFEYGWNWSKLLIYTQGALVIGFGFVACGKLLNNKISVGGDTENSSERGGN
ncbi:hypothetical protein [Vagococcus silagei]|uniref:Uncharacterized protein n=1 Tax=Vagococcus silagei TaxID=2508885 RepID=A0A4V3TVD3_9ENTE|nr:hypothetical protein [Vagococcus silagei]THB62419.1 hypothetical protein ESZ54_00995 [Vagococcus silagei]